MSHVVHATFLRGSAITAHGIYAMRRDLLRNRTLPVKHWDASDYFVLQVDHEDEYQLREIRDFRPAGWYEPILPDEIGQIMGFRVVAR